MLGLWHDGVVLSLRWCLMFCYVLDVVFAFVSCALVVDRCRVCLSALCARGGLMLCWLEFIMYTRSHTLGLPCRSKVHIVPIRLSLRDGLSLFGCRGMMGCAEFTLVRLVVLHSMTLLLLHERGAELLWCFV